MILAIHDNKTIVVVKWYKKSVTEATPKQILLSYQKPNIAAGGIFNTRQSNRAIFKVGSERPAI